TVTASIGKAIHANLDSGLFTRRPSFGSDREVGMTPDSGSLHPRSTAFGDEPEARFENRGESTRSRRPAPQASVEIDRAQRLAGSAGVPTRSNLRGGSP